MCLGSCLSGVARGGAPVWSERAPPTCVGGSLAAVAAAAQFLRPYARPTYVDGSAELRTAEDYGESSVAITDSSHMQTDGGHRHPHAHGLSASKTMDLDTHTGVGRQ